MSASSHSLSAQDLKEVLQIGRAALECNRSEELTKEVLRLMETVFRTSCSNFFFSLAWEDKLDLHRVNSLTISEISFNQFRKYYHQLDPFIQNISLSACPTTVSTEQILPYGKLVSGEYYNDFLKPQSIHSQMSIFLKNRNGLLGSFNLFRPSHLDVFSSRDRAKAELMAPILAEALNKAFTLERTATQSAMIDKILSELPFGAVLLMNEWFEPIYCSETAKEKLQGLCNDAKGGKHGCLHYLSKVLSSQFDNQTHSRSYGSNTSSRKTKVKLPTDKGELEIVARKIRMGISKSTYFALSLEPEKSGPCAARVREELKALGLTPRETEVLLLISDGLKNPEIGKRLFISDYTVENHIRAIFRKLGVSNRTAAANRLAKMTEYKSSLFWHGESESAV